ncbi:molecular chaperone DnaJ [Kordiimonas sediminis]|uniref:Molecular chaperone DnaJ n=1 Tax=Kordiimonas sediminis TaxID=1735581 RepID=A0A919AWN8_9PROT|nr:DnaJ C-terminal domain-containing protein [Kordiimonas sediminis]GHF26693.1 molecular chaperone DnaJ [Kordiimonas sediminis]
MRDLYSILDVPKSASEADVKKAYRQLAKKYHPDTNRNDARIAEKFKEVSAAYHILGDKTLRGKYDRGEIDENGNERATFAGAQGFGSQGFRSHTSRRGGQARGFSDFDFGDAEDIFADFFRHTGGAGSQRNTRSGQRSGTPNHKGLDITYSMTIGFEESITGGKRRLTLNDGRSIDIKIPEGIHEGQVIRLSGQGGPGLGGGNKGDALVEIHVADHPYYRRDGLDILLDLPISIDEAVLGGDIEIPTPRGRLTIRIPKGSSTGKRLRLKGKGVKKGDKQGNIFVTLKVTLPAERDPDLEQAIKDWGKRQGADIRKKSGL